MDETIEMILRLVKDDGYCATFQTIGQYRTQLIKEIRKIAEHKEQQTDKKEIK